MKSILDPSFRYTPSHQTDLRKTFARARREMKQRMTERITVEVAEVRVVQFNHWPTRKTA